MNIAIIYYSQTGTTKTLASMMEAGLVEKGHKVKRIELRTNAPVKGGTIRQPITFEVTNLPDLTEFDAICIGGPVWAFGPNTVTYKAILQMPDLNGKKVLPFVTMGFPFKGMGGRGAIQHMSAALAEKGAKVLHGIIVPKMFRNHEFQLKTAVIKCLALLSR
jgi:flavodoxin